MMPVQLEFDIKGPQTIAYSAVVYGRVNKKTISCEIKLSSNEKFPKTEQLHNQLLKHHKFLAFEKIFSYDIWRDWVNPPPNKNRLTELITYKLRENA